MARGFFTACALVGFLALLPALAGAAPLGEQEAAPAVDRGKVRPSLEPIHLRHGPQLFFDEYLVAESHGVEKQPDITVLRDPATGQFRPMDLKQDRLVARQAFGPAPGRLMTAPLRVRAGQGSRLLLNADAGRGHIRVQVRNVQGETMPGFTFDDCAPVTGDGAALPVQWYHKKGDEMASGAIDLVPLDNQTIRLEFEISNAKLFGFDLEPGKERPLRMAQGPHLFVDDHLIAESDNLQRRVRSPERLDRPVLGREHHPEARFGPTTLLYDAERDRFQLWYWNRVSDMEIRYLETSDPLRWPGPGEVVFRFKGDPGMVIRDDEPYVRDPQRRYKLAYFPDEPFQSPSVAFSPDGKHWTLYDGNPVLRYYPFGHPRWSQSVSDILDPYWDPIRRRYGMLVKMYSDDDREFGMNSRTSAPGMGIRLTGITHSDDFVHWSQPVRLFEPDFRDEGVFEHYGGFVIARGDLLIAFMRILRDDLGPEGIGYTVLASSRDGHTWTRDREIFLDRNPREGAHDRAFAWVRGGAIKGDAMYLAYAAYDTGHKTGHRHIGLAWLPRDRYVSRRPAGTGQARLRTPLLAFVGGTLGGLTVNADASRGALIVRVLDETGKPIPGLEQSSPLRSDGLATAVQWPEKLSAVTTRPFRLEFLLDNADLYGFSFSGASGDGR